MFRAEHSKKKAETTWTDGKGQTKIRQYLFKVDIGFRKREKRVEFTSKKDITLNPNRKEASSGIVQETPGKKS